MSEGVKIRALANLGGTLGLPPGLEPLRSGEVSGGHASRAPRPVQMERNCGNCGHRVFPAPHMECLRRPPVPVWDGEKVVAVYPSVTHLMVCGDWSSRE